MNLLKEIGLQAEKAERILAEAPPSLPPDLGDVEEPQEDGAVSKIIDAIFTVPNGKMRAVLAMSSSELKSIYLTTNGAVKFVESLTDKMLDTIASDDTFFKVVGSKFEMADVVNVSKSDRPLVVLLNIDDNLIAQLSESEISGHKEVRDFLIEAFSQANYVATLNAPAIKSAHAATKEDFSVTKFVAAYPDKNLITAAREEEEQQQPIPEPPAPEEAKPEPTTVPDLGHIEEPKVEETAVPTPRSLLLSEIEAILPAMPVKMDLSPVPPPAVVAPPAQPAIPAKQELKPMPKAEAQLVGEISINRSAIEDALRQALASEKRATKWTFTIKRNSQGFIETIEAQANS
jgi:hypothetical protein